MLNSIFALAVIVITAFGMYAVCGVPSRLAPLVAVAVLIDITLVMSMTGMLKAGVIIACICAAVLFAVAAVKYKRNIKEKITGFLSPGVVLFVTASLVMLMVLSYTQPVIHRWDEFSFWGISRKLVKNHDALYTYFQSSMLGRSIPPSLPVLTYFFQRFSPQFTEWVCYFAYDVLLFACFAAFTGAAGREKAHNAIFVFALAFIIPYFFRAGQSGGKIADLYITTYSDIPMAMVFAGAMAVYFFTEDNNSRSVISVLPVLAFLTLIKDMGLALGCIVLFMAFFDMVIGRKEYTFLRIKGFAGKCVSALVMLAVTGASYIGWSMHLSHVLSINRSEFGGESGMGMAEMLITGIKALVFGTTDEKFITVKNSMITAFSQTKVSMIGSGLNVVLFITGVFFIAFILSDRKGRKRTAVMYLTSLTGFLGYYIFHIFLYVYIFSREAYTLASYDRYMYIYYIGWFMVAVCCLSMAAKDGISTVASASLLALLAGCFFICSIFLDTGNTFLAVNETSFGKKQLIDAKSEFISDVVGEDDVVMLFSTDNNGEHWFMYSYNFADNYFPPEIYIETWGMSPEEEKETRVRELGDYMKEKGVTHILVDQVDENLIRNYAHTFNGYMYKMGLDTVAYYKVNYYNDTYWCELVKEGSIYG